MSTLTPARSGDLGRSFLKELDFTPEEWQSLLDLAQHLKRELYTQPAAAATHGRQHRRHLREGLDPHPLRLRGRRPRPGAHVTYLDPSGSHLGHKESAKDTARVLGRMYDAIEYRGFAQATVETLATYSGVPVWNGLTDQWHPTQSLCDMLTMREHAHKPDDEIAFAYVGDAHNNVANSLLVAGAMMGMDVRMVAPTSLSNPPEVVEAAQRHRGEHRRADHADRRRRQRRRRRRLRLHRRVGLDGRARGDLAAAHRPAARRTRSTASCSTRPATPT